MAGVLFWQLGSNSSVIELEELPKPYREMIRKVELEGVKWDELEAKEGGSKVEEKGKGDEKKEKTFEDIVPEPYRDFEDVFSKQNFDKLPERRACDHAIEIFPGGKFKDCKLFPLAPAQVKELDKFIEENLTTGRIRPSTSPMASPFFFIKTKDGSLRPVQDYPYLNSITVKNRYPLPLIADLIDKLKDATTVLDYSPSGYDLRADCRPPARGTVTSFDLSRRPARFNLDWNRTAMLTGAFYVRYPRLYHLRMVVGTPTLQGG